MIKRGVFIGLLLIVTAVGVYLVVPSSVSARGSGGPGSVIVLCSNCYYPGLPQQSHLVLMDGRTGEIWAYSDFVIAGGGEPAYVGTLSAVGQPITNKNRGRR